MSLKYEYSVESVDELNVKSKVYYSIETETKYECLECGYITTQLGGHLMCEDCHQGNQKEIIEDIIIFRKLINSQWYSYRTVKPDNIDKYLKLINNITKLDDIFWNL